MEKNELELFSKDAFFVQVGQKLMQGWKKDETQFFLFSCITARFLEAPKSRNSLGRVEATKNTLPL